MPTDRDPPNPWVHPSEKWNYIVVWIALKKSRQALPSGKIELTVQILDQRKLAENTIHFPSNWSQPLIIIP